jgi:hypothetical protein
VENLAALIFFKGKDIINLKIKKIVSPHACIAGFYLTPNNNHQNALFGTFTIRIRLQKHGFSKDGLNIQWFIKKYSGSIDLLGP